MKIRKLHWEEDEPNWWIAQPPSMIGGFGYEVRLTDRGVVRCRRGTEPFHDFEGTLNDAKEFWQADFEFRIMSAVEEE